MTAVLLCEGMGNGSKTVVSHTLGIFTNYVVIPTKVRNLL